ncbi:hypothetical protein H6763_01860 [Candidatus Nomurabacteria bacterium]|uniref:Uncharacterized protein n=1 Tax=Candidatus Dojkabacteria bacterium TaxID=2099670 RepID=A0A955I0D3_9BACT|nr:hypothetical protein [Candidatus Dojkabacteria bacterium]MCB9789823.1 hypothetical protein [Candidatus Nomurabacteria bacterium]MCB9803553.1 hypothetical protein [Candidatus Nomurabacteria bacterium]
MEEFLYNSLSFIPTSISFVPLLGLVYFVGMMIFWWEADLAKKNRNSIFDQWFFSTLLMLVWGRVTYIITSWDQFSQWNWFYLPYERYGEQIYLFRAMPWRLFSIWDGGFLFIPMFLAYLILGYFYTVYIKKWRWREMMGSVLFSANFLLGSALLLYGLYARDSRVTLNGFLVFIFSFVIQVVVHSIKRFYKDRHDPYRRMSRVLVLFYLVLDIWFISYTFLSQPLINMDRYHIYGFVILGCFMAISYILDIRRKTPTTDDQKTLTPRRISLNQAIRISDKKDQN